MKIDDDRETMPVFDESIFYPEERCKALGLDSEDIDNIVSFVRWNMDQRDKRIAKQKLLEILRKRKTQLAMRKKIALLQELESLGHDFKSESSSPL